MADAFTAPLRTAAAWIPCDSPIEAERIDDAIVEWHTEHGMPAPTNDEFAAAVYAIPAGSDWSGWPQHPTRVRVTLASGVRYELSVEIDGGYGDDGTGWRMFFAVEVHRG